MKLSFYLAIILVFLRALVTPANAQNQNLRFEHLGIQDGLLNEYVTAMLEDSKGFMWFGTFDGLYKYDGYTFTKYQFDPADSNSISQNFIYTIFEDKYNVIWVSTFEGLCRFDRATEKFTRYKPLPNAKFFNPNICVINEDNYGMLWVGCTSGELCRFDRNAGKFLDESFDLDIRIPGGIDCLYKDREGTLWVGRRSGLYELHLAIGKKGIAPGVVITKHYPDDRGPGNSLGNIVGSIIEDHNGIMWLGTKDGLKSYNKKSGIWKRYRRDPGNPNSISNNNLMLWFGKAIEEDEEGNLWIGTADGLNKLNSDRTFFTSYFTDPHNTHSLSTSYITALHIDKGGVLWVAGKAGGPDDARWGAKLNKAPLNINPFNYIVKKEHDINSLSDNQVTAILEDSAGGIWAGTHQQGLDRWNRKNNLFEHFRADPGNPKSLRHDTITAILEDRHGNIWVCNGDELSRLNTRTLTFTHHTVPPGGLAILSITEDQHGYLWIGTGNGICRFDETKGEFSDFYYYDPKNPEGLSDGTSSALFADSRDNIWIGHGSRGTDRLNIKTGKFSHYKYDSHNPRSISSNIVNCFFEDSKGKLWLGTFSGGLCRFDYNTESFKTFTAGNGMASTTIFSIIEDNSGRLWMGTRNGLSQFDPVTEEFKNYDITDGLPGNIFAAGLRERGGRCKGRDGTLYFGARDGLTFFSPEKIKANLYQPPIAITQFKIFDSLVRGASERKLVFLNYAQNHFSFEFASLNFYNTSKNQYAYKLEGVDKDWVYSGARRYAGYTNIEPGKYTFRVKGTNNDGFWNEEDTSMTIVITPPWYRTWGAYLLLTLTLAGLVYAFVRYRINKFRMRHEIIVQKQRTSELEMQALRAQMNPHFIFNSLNSINRFILQNNVANASEYLTKFSKLIRLILHNSNASLITLESELEALQLYLELESLRFNHRFNFKICVDDEVDIEGLKLPPLLIQPYAENAIWHGLMHLSGTPPGKSAAGNLVIEISKEDCELKIRISDDGIGRKKAAALKSKSATTHKSMGLKITEDRIAMMNKKTNQQSVFINDLFHPDGSAAGTEVIIKLPVIYDQSHSY